MVKIKLVPILIFVIAIGIAFFVALATYNRLQKKSVVETKPAETLSVAVAKSDLSWGTSINKSMIKMVPYLKESLPSGYFSNHLTLEGRTLIYPVKMNEPIFESKLAPTSVTTGGIAAVLTPEKRAMSVKVDKVIGISGFIHSGNRVDVLVTTKQGETGSSKVSITKTVLENILVLAAGPEIESDSNQQKSKGVDVITLEVTPEEAEKLALATSEGKIQLALRNFVDTKDVITRGSTISTLLSSYRGRDLSKVTSTPLVTSESFSVTLIKGSIVNKLTF